MARICTSSTSPSGCGHRDITIDGRTYHLHDSELSPLSDDELTLLDLLTIRHKGIALAQLANRVTFGDEATNVKTYDFLGPGNAVTKTNIGTSYVNVLPGANGERILVDCTGCTEFRPVLTANLVGTGAFGVRIVRDSDNTVFYENSNIAQTGERELDPGWQTLPAWATGLEVLRLQAKSVTAADDPIFRRCVVLVK